jgi:hypothetical protein
MRITICRKTWRLRFVPRLGKDNRGDCASPRAKDKQIRIATRYRGKELIELMIHECLHAGLWCLDEEAVHDIAHDIARTLARKEIWQRISDGQLLPNTRD